jgi:hypothetical protein
MSSCFHSGRLRPYRVSIVKFGSFRLVAAPVENLKVPGTYGKLLPLYTIMNMLWLSIYTSMNTFINLKSWALALQNILDTLSDVLDKVYASL